MIGKIRKLLKQNAKLTNAVNKIGLALLAGFAAVELAFQRSKIVFGKFKIIAMRNKIASAVISLILFMGIVIGGIAIASGDEYPTLENEVGVEEDYSTYPVFSINLLPAEPQEVYIPQTSEIDEEEPETIEADMDDDEVIIEIVPEPPRTEEPAPNEDDPDDDEDDDDEDLDNEDDPPPPRQCVWVRVYTQQTFDRGSYQERTIIAGQQELWMIKDGWAIGRRFYSLNEANEFLTGAENLAAQNPSTGFTVQFENIYATVIVWVPNIVTENVFSHERCNDCGAVREN